MKGSAITLEYMRKRERRLCYLAVILTFIICSALIYVYKPNAYEIKMNEQHVFYIKDKESFQYSLNSLQGELKKKYENFRFEDKFTWSKVLVDSKVISSEEEAKNFILSNSKSVFKEANSKSTNSEKEKSKANEVKKESNKAAVEKVAVKNNASNNSKTVLGSKIKLLIPIEGVVSSNFGMRWGKMHKGIDIANEAGTPIYAAMDGKVTYSGWIEGYGKVIIIDHGNKLETIYGHCSVLRVKVGDTVTKGHHIGDVGSTGRSTGPHVHFEVRINGVAENPSKYI